jgi:hypothetical protein
MSNTKRCPLCGDNIEGTERRFANELASRAVMGLDRAIGFVVRATHNMPRVRRVCCKVALWALGEDR